MSKKTFRYLFIIAASIVAAIALGSSFRSEKTDETRRKPLNLNKTLTNEMSDTSDLAGLDKSITRFMQEWNLQGVSLSIMRNDSLLYAKGYGWADEEKGVRMSPGIILRMASVSKLLTATGIMVLQEQGRLSLRDSVFGPSGILN
ncbi:MAG: serine hydrolase, partial [Bacteroidales bacterium]|nr:serine hydrolase [Bacteroidales bacterium]